MLRAGMSRYMYTRAHAPCSSYIRLALAGPTAGVMYYTGFVHPFYIRTLPGEVISDDAG